ncbi:sulfite exporter TauE/SafE family protein [Kocuria sp. NPDC057446]|uniref:sulfite exporter TauE/SafE family protein n=1 Tax=Kocuria sp. NPDC057446 TaxID=3346137 RepID=UPI00369657E7
MLEAAVILVAGFWAGMINVVVGSGTLVTFPTLLLFGYPPLTANVSNNIGLVFGGLSGSWGYRREAAENKQLLVRLLPISLLGGLTGAMLLLVLPASAFGTIVPVLILLGLLMVAAGPALQRRAARVSARSSSPRAPRGRAVALAVGTAVLGMYGGYFGAAQGILLMGLMSVVTVHNLQQVTGIKNVLVTAVNAVAAGVFLLAAGEAINWTVIALIAVGSTLGGFAGARFGRRLSPTAMRTLILVIGVAALARMAFAG